MREVVAQRVYQLMAQSIADADRLKSVHSDERPGSASINDVRLAYADAMEELSQTYTSASQLSGFDLPSDRLKEVTE